ncbi:MFS transporter [Gimesia fumaroli]|uniref:MFS transporter n=1 Tax=Gimesia fumaroli TaxID=2527976 RepID=UPI00119E956C|nr:MFS transporter [Gimesia fumaroli]
MRFADPFLILYFLDLKLSFSQIGLLLGLQHIVTVLLELPSGILADRWGRNRAIMLDYLDSSGQSGLVTQLISRTRAVSRISSAIAALSGGMLLSWSRDYAWLFFLSMGAAVCGFVLMLTYPRELEGDSFRDRQQRKVSDASSITREFRGMLSGGRLWAVFAQSVVFESQMKITLKSFTQPFLKARLDTFGLPIISSPGAVGLAHGGAFWVGLNEFIRDGLGGLGSRLGPYYEQLFRSRITALNRLYVCGTLFVAEV